MFASAVGKLLGCSGLVEPIGGGVIQWSRNSLMYSEVSMTGAKVLSQLATINLSSLRSSWSALLMSEEVAGLRRVAKALRRRTQSCPGVGGPPWETGRVLRASILWIHTSWDWSGGLSWQQRHCSWTARSRSRWQCDAGPRLGVAWSGNELGVQSKKEAGFQGMVVRSW
jgi:hypothetical protein